MCFDTDQILCEAMHGLYLLAREAFVFRGAGSGMDPSTPGGSENMIRCVDLGRREPLKKQAFLFPKRFYSFGLAVGRVQP